MRHIIRRLKGSISGKYPLQPDEARLLISWLNTRDNDSPILFTSRRNLPISRIMLRLLMGRYGQKVGLPEDKRHFHVLKHSIITHMFQEDADVRFVEDWVGHSNIQNTMLYAHIISTIRDEKARKVFLKLPRF